MEITGVIKKVFDAQVVSEKFKKRDFVLITEENTPYPQNVILQLVQDKVHILDKHQEGDEVKVQFNLRGREWISPQGEVKYFNTLDAWRIEVMSSSREVSRKPAEANKQNFDSTSTIHTSTSSDDDLPF